MYFKDRFDAAERLSKELEKYRNNKDAVILAIPRGGLQIGNVLAKRLNLRLDVVLTKKIGYPGNPEFAIGAVSLKGEVIDKDFVKTGEVSQKYIGDEVKRIREKLKERYKMYAGKEKPVNLKDKIVIITDDGIATGKTMLATIDLIKKDKPKKIIVAIPVGPEDTIEMLKKYADEVICLYIPESFFAIGEFYRYFPQVEDEEAIKLLKEANK